MNKHVPQQDTGRVIAVAVAFFGALAILGLLDGVFARLGTDEITALAAFAVGFAGATYVLDESVRGWVRTLLRRPARVTKAAAKSPGGTRAAT